MSTFVHKKEKRNQRMRAWSVKHETAQDFRKVRKKGTLGEWVPTVVEIGRAHVELQSPS